MAYVIDDHPTGFPPSMGPAYPPWGVPQPFPPPLGPPSTTVGAATRPWPNNPRYPQPTGPFGPPGGIDTVDWGRMLARPLGVGPTPILPYTDPVRPPRLTRPGAPWPRPGGIEAAPTDPYRRGNTFTPPPGAQHTYRDDLGYGNPIKYLGRRSWEL